MKRQTLTKCLTAAVAIGLAIACQSKREFEKAPEHKPSCSAGDCSSKAAVPASAAKPAAPVAPAVVEKAAPVQAPKAENSVSPAPAPAVVEKGPISAPAVLAPKAETAAVAPAVLAPKAAEVK